MILSRALVAVLAAFVLVAIGAGSAAAASDYRFDVELDDGSYFSSSTARITVSDLDAAQGLRIYVVSPVGANKLDSGVLPSGSSSYISPYISDLAAGDRIEVRQPAGAALPTESFTIPEFGLSLVNGATALTGSVPAGWIATVMGDDRCGRSATGNDVGPGPFSIPYPAVGPGERVSMMLGNPAGDRVKVESHSPGETPCVFVVGKSNQPLIPGDVPEPNPYSVGVDNLIPSVTQSVRLVLRRGATILADISEDFSSTNTRFSTEPLPGDVVDVYRPKTASTPTFSRTIPQVSSVFDASIDTVAVDSPAAGLLRADLCRVYACPRRTIRAALDVSAGRNLLDFGKPQAALTAVDLRTDDRILVSYVDSSYTLRYFISSSRGDLVAPRLSFSLASKLTVARVSNGLRLKIKSNEAGSAKFALAFPKPRSATLATTNSKLKVGSTSVRLKLTKSGIKALKKLRKGSSRTAVLTSTVKDAAGNSATVVKKTKIVG